MKQEFREINPSFARIFINHKDPKNPVTITYPAKKGAFGLVYAMWMQMYSKAWTLLFIGNGIAILTVMFLQALDTSSASTSLDLPMLMFPWMGFVFSSIGWVPLVLTIITLKNKKLYAKMPDWFTNYIIWKENEYLYLRKTKLTSKKLEIPVFSNLFLDYKTSGDFKKYLKTMSIEEHDLIFATYDRKGRRKGVRNDEHWKATFTFEKIPKRGYIEIRFI